ncbi:hypothetical protein [Saccharothrix violaceirubra]|uniref:Uncharacterized protein n=1 Tax=Saccharothrix violaceirubra TaxID=413306 RepID=A0A7W7T5J7_9PSEU|nr:hypothetical protein [Saccharothrix violaceirubra]MBB4965685.1 hypothetical protein [Saccharothrix violaceirubra]
MDERFRSWAADEDEVRHRRRHAERLTGQHIVAVRYYDIDYRREEFAPDASGPRTVDDETEWANPTWRYPGFDAVDFAVELETAAGEVYTLTWDLPGHWESLGIHNAPAIGEVVSTEASVAIWNVGDRTKTWAPMTRTPLTGIDLHYHPWPAPVGGFWCSRITLHTATTTLHIVLGDAGRDGLTSSADNLAILHPTTPIPNWPTALS